MRHQLLRGGHAAAQSAVDGAVVAVARVRVVTATDGVACYRCPQGARRVRVRAAPTHLPCLLLPSPLPEAAAGGGRASDVELSMHVGQIKPLNYCQQLLSWRLCAALGVNHSGTTLATRNHIGHSTRVRVVPESARVVDDAWTYALLSLVGQTQPQGGSKKRVHHPSALARAC